MGQYYMSFTKIQTLHLCLYFMFGFEILRGGKKIGSGAICEVFGKYGKRNKKEIKGKKS